MKEISRLPELDWCERAKAQMARTDGEALLRASQAAYRLGNAAVIGLIYQSFFSPPWLWFALAQDVTMRDLIDFRRMQHLIPRGALVAIEDGDEVAYRFAAFYGFTDTGTLSEQDGLTYTIMRKN